MRCVGDWLASPLTSPFVGPGAAQKSLEEIRRDLNVKFDLQYVDEKDIPPQAIHLYDGETGARL